MRSPGRNPRRSPASTAGRVRMMRLNCLACRLCTPSATARYDLPVPAGPIPKVITLRAIASTYGLWPLVFGRTVRPRAERRTAAVKPSDGGATRGRTHAMPTEHVQVQVGHRVAGVVAHVDHQPVARLGDAFLGRDPLSRRDHLREEVTVLGPKGGGRLDVVARHYEHVHG